MKCSAFRKAAKLYIMYNEDFICISIKKHLTCNRYIAEFVSIKKDEGYTSDQINIWIDEKDKNKYETGKIYNLSIK